MVTFEEINFDGDDNEYNDKENSEYDEYKSPYLESYIVEFKQYLKKAAAAP